MRISLLLIISTISLSLYTNTYGWPARAEQYAHENGVVCTGSHLVSTVYDKCESYMFGVTSARLLTGSCFKFFKERECKGSSYILGYPDTEMCQGGTPYEGMSVLECDSWTSRITCPNGTYVRSLGYGQNDLRTGVTIHCFGPRNSNATGEYVYTTHGNTTDHVAITKCPVAGRGLSFSRDSRFEIETRAMVACQPNGASKPCSGISALIGLQVSIDERNTIKQTSAICKDVPDPSDMCDPAESMAFVYLCDNSQSGNEMTCGYSITVGVGYSNTTTVGESQEYQFYSEYGYSIGGTLRGLSASMSYKLGKSELVAYEWSQSDTSTWKMEETMSVSTKLRPYSATRVEQLSGKCSFYGVSVNYFKQTDINVTHTVETFFSL